MKRTKIALRAITLLLLLLLCLIPLTACGEEEESASCKISFQIDGKLYTTVDYVEGKALKLPPDPAKAGLSFTGWYLDTACTRPLTAEAYRNAETLTVYAGWINPDLIGKFTVSVNLGGKGTHDDLYIPSGTTVSGIHLPEVPGYHVTGWYTDASLQTPFDLLHDKVTKDLTLYAKWELETYTATLMADDAAVGRLTFTIDTASLTLPSVPEKTGYRGTWESYALGTSDITIRAVYTPVTYTVTYEGTKGAECANATSYTVLSGLTLTPISHPDFLFLGWSLDGTSVIESIAPGATGDITLTALWEKRPAVITYAGLEDGTHTNPTSFRESAEAHTLTPASRPWYRFLGWFSDAALTSPITVLSRETVTGDMTLYAKFAPISYTVTYMNGETPVGSATFDVNNQTPTPPALPEKAGYLASWGTFVPSPADQFVSVSFSPVVYQITYAGMSAGTANPNPSSYTIESAFSLLAPTRAGYFFKGWKLGGETVTEIPAGTTGNLTLEADFGLIEYAIHYENLYGIPSATFPGAFTVESEAITLPGGLVREGYTFLGWSLGGATVTEISRGTVGNVSLSARWAAKEYTITYLGLPVGAVNPNPTTYTVESAITLSNPGLPGFTFHGWTKNGAPVTEIPLGSMGDITISASATAISYAIGYANTAGISTDGFRTSYTAAEAVTLPTGLKRTGETLTGWLLEGETVTTLEVGTVGNLTLTAVWTPDVYHITYEGLASGDKNENPATYTVKDRVELLAPSRAGYRFLGWKQGEAPVSFLPEGSTGHVTLTATFEPISYTVTYENLLGASASALPTEFTVLSQDISLPSVTTLGRTFLGWTKNGVPVTEIPEGSVGNVTLRAEWRLDRYAITYAGLSSGDKNENPASYTVEDEITLTTPSRAGHTFLGWRKNDAPSTGIAAGSTGSVTFTAVFEPIVYTITYENMLGISSEGFPKTFTVLSGAITLPSGLTSPGGTFLGWKRDGASVTSIPAGTMGNITVSATWETIRYEITYFGLESGDSNPNPSSYTIAETVVLKAPIRLGYTFTGWTRNGEPVTEIPEGSTGNVNLTASFVPTQYHISYENTKGADTSTFPSRYINNGTKVTLPTLTPPAGFVFVGWALPDGSMITEIAPGTTGDVSLTATFQPTTYTLTLHPMGGTLTTRQVEVRVDEPYSLPVPQKEGYAFLGWYLNTGDDAGAMTGADGASLADYPYGSNRILYARYTPVQYSIRFVTNGGSVLPLGTYTHGELFRPLDHKAEIGTGAYFAGWYTADGSTEYTAQTPVTADVTLYAKWLESIPISNAAELSAIRDNPSATYHLTQNITLSGETFTPIPEFSGILDGAGFAIRNFTMDNKKVAAAYAMFVENTGVIKNLTVKEFSYTFNVNQTTTLQAGILCARNAGVIENCAIEGTPETAALIEISYNSTGSATVHWGVFAGSNSGTIRACRNSVSADYTTHTQTTNTSNYGDDRLTTHYYFGGIAGVNEATGVIVSCQSSQTISLISTTATSQSRDSVSQSLYVGAVMGHNLGLSENSYSNTIMTTNCTGSSYLYAGGFVGRNAGSINGGSAAGSFHVSCTSTTYIGGFVGHNVAGETVIRGSHSALTLHQSGASGAQVGGFVGRNEAKVMTSYASGNVTSTVSASTGGFVGYSNDGSTISQSFAMGDVSKPSGNTGAFVGTHGNTSATLYCYYLSNATLTVGGVHTEHVTENKNVVGKSYIELLSEELLIGSLEWNDGDWILLFDESPILAWEKDIGHDYDITVVEPDCENFGYSVYSCTHCGRFFLSDFTDAWGHAYDALDATVIHPTCSLPGYTSNVCRVCLEEVRTAPTEPRAHESDGTVLHKDPTCTEAGYDRYTCALCEETYDTVIPAKGHTPEVTIAYLAPTCRLSELGQYLSTPGHTAEEVCSVCDHVIRQSVEIAPHVYVLDTSADYTEATCTQDGSGTFKCTHCGHPKVDAIPATGHADQNHDGCCDSCRVFIGLEGVIFIEIRTADDLKKIAENPYAAYRLMNDIDLYGTVFTPLCSATSPFMGFFDGNGYKILNLDCGDAARGGLFDTIGNRGVVRALTINGVTAHITKNGIFGAIAATNMGVISECTVTGTISFRLSGSLSIAEKAAATKTVIATFGAVVGENKGMSAMIYGCTVSGKIAVSAQSHISIGVKNSVFDYILRKNATLKNTVSVTAGAIAGVNEATIENCLLQYTEFGYLVGAHVSRPDGSHQFGFAYSTVVMELDSVAGVNHGTVENTAEGLAILERDWSVQPTYIRNTYSNEQTITLNVK